jgi:hypothetical protein
VRSNLQEKINKLQDVRTRAVADLAIELDIEFIQAQEIIDNIIEGVLSC